MFLNETLLVLAYTANMMATLPEEAGTRNVSAIQNVTTTTLSPEEEENKFDMDDRKCELVVFEKFARSSTRSLFFLDVYLSLFGGKKTVESLIR